MAYEQKSGTGAIFKNNKTSDNHPDYRGSFLTPSGEKLDIALWVQTSREGTKYFSAAIQEPYHKNEAPSTKPDDLPF